MSTTDSPKVEKQVYSSQASSLTGNSQRTLNYPMKTRLDYIYEETCSTEIEYIRRLITLQKVRIDNFHSNYRNSGFYIYLFQCLEFFDTHVTKPLHK